MASTLVTGNPLFTSPFHTTRHLDDALKDSLMTVAIEQDAEGKQVSNQRINGTGTSLGLILLKAAVSVGMGIVFGLVLDRSGVMYPAVIRTQFIFANFAMIKMWLAGVGTSAICFSLFSIFLRNKFKRSRLHRPWGDKGLVTNASGGFIQGIGMAFCGACPGMTMGQIGAQVPYSWLILVGGFIGAVVHLFFDDLVRRRRIADFENTYKRFSPNTGFLDLRFKTEYAVLAILLIMALAGVIAAFEVCFQWTNDLASVVGIRSESSGLINPTLAGVSVGLLQIPAFILLGNSFLGTSAAYSIVASQWLRMTSSGAKERYKYSSENLNSSSAWQITFGIGALLGGYLSYSTSTPSSPVPGVGPVFAGVGGFFLIFGARVAGGCASGHGLTGLSLLSIAGWVTVPFMFGGAILTSFIMRWTMGEALFSLA